MDRFINSWFSEQFRFVNLVESGFNNADDMFSKEQRNYSTQ